MSDIPEYVLHAKLKNNLLLSRILADSATVGAFAKKYDLDAGHLGELVNLRHKALGKSGWFKLPRQLAEIFGCLPEELFSEEQREVALKTNAAYINLTTDQALYAFLPATDPMLRLENMELVDRVRTALECLTDRERTIIEARMDDRTREEIGQELGLSHSRVLQIEEHALRKLRHPNRSLKLRDCLEPVDYHTMHTNEDGWTIHEPPAKPEADAPCDK